MYSFLRYVNSNALHMLNGLSSEKNAVAEHWPNLVRGFFIIVGALPGKFYTAGFGKPPYFAFSIFYGNNINNHNLAV